jgi:hypothetical protein
MEAPAMMGTVKPAACELAGRHCPREAYKILKLFFINHNTLLFDASSVGEIGAMAPNVQVD